jgi:hypothetical protein
VPTSRHRACDQLEHKPFQRGDDDHQVLHDRPVLDAEEVAPSAGFEQRVVRGSICDSAQQPFAGELAGAPPQRIDSGDAGSDVEWSRRSGGCGSAR